MLLLSLLLSLLLLLLLLSLLDLAEKIVIVKGERVAVDADYLKRVYSREEEVGVYILAPLSTLLVCKEVSLLIPLLLSLLVIIIYSL